MHEVNQFWEEEWNYSERFMPEIIEMLGRVFVNLGWGEPTIRVASLEEDMHHNTDLFAIFPNGLKLRISVRVRKWDPRKFEQYVQEFTIRCFLALNKKLRTDENGYVITDTEFKKTMDGWGDIIVYCFADPTDTQLASMYVGDTNKFREFNRFGEKHSGEGMVYIRKGGAILDQAKIVREWDERREHVAGNTGCGFLTYKKEGAGAIPGMTIADYKFKERWGGIA